jgi:hypothetical protein
MPFSYCTKKVLENVFAGQENVSIVEIVTRVLPRIAKVGFLCTFACLTTHFKDLYAF